MHGILDDETKPTRQEFRGNLMKLTRFIEDKGKKIDYSSLDFTTHTNYFVQFGQWGMFGSNCTNHLCYLVEESMGFPFGKIEPDYPDNDVFIYTKTDKVSDDGSRTCSTITTTYELEKENN